MAICDLKRDNVYALTAVLVLVIAVSVFAAVVSYNLQSDPEVYGPKKPFHLGVTYCGSSVNEAKLLVDRVKNYTNLFVVQSNYLQAHFEELVNVCDYAVDAGLNIIVYSSSYQIQQTNLEKILAYSQQNWGNHLLGVYYDDEPGGKMLDGRVELGNLTKDTSGVDRLDFRNGTVETHTSFSKTGEVTIQSIIRQSDNGHDVSLNTFTCYFVNGTIGFAEYKITQGDTISTEWLILNYQPDGTVQDENGETITNQGNITRFTPYQQLWDSRPLKTCSETADAYTNKLHNTVAWINNRSDVKVFTSDYALYWFDYMAGYDTVLAQLGPNGNLRQEIALIRGAANMHDKQWGTILTWKNSTDSSSLMTGEVMYDALKLSYLGGAKYAVVFNYAPDANGTGLLQDEHYSAIQRFWTDIVQNPDISNNITIHDALVLPADYGWGMRSVNDTIWGLWQPDEKAAQIWNSIQQLLGSKDGKVDIIYEDSTSQATARYSGLQYWNSTA